MLPQFVLALIGFLAASTAIAAPIDQGKWTSMKKEVRLSNGVRLSYVELGGRNAPPVLLLHGFTDSSRSWSLVAPHLARYRLLIPDQRGHGASDATACCYSVTQLAEDAKLLLDALHIERAAVAGHSLGSMVAMTLAAEHPDRVIKIALLGSTALVPVTRGDWLWTNVAGLTFPIDPKSQFMSQWAADPRLVEPAFANAARAETFATPRQVWQGVARELTDLPVGRHAADVKAPVLILSGGKDPFFGAEHQAALAKAFPKASSHVYPELGHNFLWEAPADVGGHLSDFFAR